MSLRPSGADAIIASLEARLFPLLHRVADEPHMVAIREAMGPSFAGLIAATVVAFFIPPEPSLTAAYSQLATRFFAAYHVGFGFMGVALVILLAFRLARAFGFNAIVGCLVAFGCFVSALPWPLDRDVPTELGDISSTSILLGLAVALAAGEALRWARIWVRNGAVAHALGAAAVGAVFAAFAAMHVSIGDLLLAAIRPLVDASDTLPGLLVVVFFQALLWTAGVHGPAFLSGIVTPVFLKALDENSQALAMHHAPPHIVTFMLPVFYFPGGSGATLPLAILMLRSRVDRLRKLAFASLLPNVWNVNEMLIFGVPLVMNPSLTIPFVLTPLVLATITYVAMWLGLVGHTVVFYPPIFPAVVSAWLATAGDWRAVALSAINFAVGAAIYAPFYRAYENTVLARPASLDKLVSAAEAIREYERELELHPERAGRPAP